MNLTLYLKIRKSTRTLPSERKCTSLYRHGKREKGEETEKRERKGRMKDMILYVNIDDNRKRQ